tara:strand:+ start:3715 stop:4989 length:1275 start_codon:yes stop_codon:yes gene_type:complete
MTSFNELNISSRILDAIESVGYETTTPIQERTIPVALKGRDVLGLAQTGTGKTAAFTIPILQKLINADGQSIKALIIAPTRELADQINETVKQLSKYTKLKSLTVYGGVNKKPEVTRLQRRVDILIACPGRLLDHLKEKSLHLNDLEVLVLDEADTMFDMGFLPDITKILTYLPNKHQSLLFAATMPKPIKQLTDKIFDSPETIQIGTIKPAKTVSHHLYPINEKMKKDALLKILNSTPTGQILIFTRTKFRTKKVFADLEKNKFRVVALQGNMSQNKRMQSMNGFKQGKYDILVATDIASRGIDVSNVTHVINYDMPTTVDTYIHRIGRTGRASKEGEAYTFMLPEDSGMVKRIEKVLGENIEKRFLEDFNYGDMKAFDSPKLLHKSNRFKRQTNFKKTSTKQSRTRNQSKNYRPPSKKQSNV